jgi:hypothetical protein
MASRAKWRRKKVPKGYEYIDPTLTALESELRESE